MKKNFLSLQVFLFVALYTNAQNIGIGTTNPLSRLDVNGDIAFRSADLTITTTYNYALDVNTSRLSSYRLVGQVLPPLGNFILAGITAGANGRVVSLHNRSGFSMEVYNEDANANAANRITTGTGTTFAIYNGGTVTLRYDATSQRWEIIGSHYNNLDYFGGGGGTSYWDLSGTNIYNSNTGNVGIGNSSPSFKLDITGDQRISGTPITTPGFNGGLTSGGALRLYNNSNTLFLKIDGSIMQAEKSNSQSTGTKASDLLINPYGGNVGISYLTPLSKLFVRKTSNISSPEGSFAAFGTQYGSYFHYGTTEDTYIRGGLDGSKVIINDGSLGNVGIGLSSPAYKLTVLGSVLNSSGNTDVLQMAGVNPLMAITDQNGGPLGYIKGITSLLPQFARTGIEIGTGGKDIYFTAQGYNAAMMINGTNNNVGIGTNNPTYKLSVVGNIRAQEVVVENGWADYVFDNNYKLPDLKEVAAHIQQHKHLPGVPSAKEVKANGLKVGEMQAKMMEKIEELTLYVIELKKEIEALKVKNQLP